MRPVESWFRFSADILDVFTPSEFSITQIIISLDAKCHKRFDKTHCITYYELDMQKEQTSIVLASTSPRRRELMTRLGLEFVSIAVDVDESPHAGETPEELVRRLSLAKVESGLHAYPESVVIGADTIVSIDGTILGKPTDEQDAVRMLKLLRGRSHVVFTGLVVARATRLEQYLATTTVWMRDYSDDEIAVYVGTGDPLDKAAAYAIQHAVFHPVARVEGCHANVMGLPLCRVYLGLKEFGVQVQEPGRFLTSFLEIECPVSQEIVRRTRQHPAAAHPPSNLVRPS
jgi:septum formation protein